jgi:hypothetical protein
MKRLLTVGSLLLSVLLLASPSWAGRQDRQTYRATGSFTPVATPTDLITITGSATKLIRVVSLKIGTTNTAAGSQEFLLIKRSTLDTTGTFVAATAVPSDSTGPGGQVTTATTTVGHYTANPGGLGTAVGTIHRKRVASPAVIPASFAGVAVDASVELLEFPVANNALDDPSIRLRGAAENLAVNFAGAALVAGQTHIYTVVWTEE